MIRVAVDLGRSGVKVDGEGLDENYTMSIIRNPGLDPETKDSVFSIIKGRGPFRNHKETYILGQKNSTEAFTLASEGESFIFNVKMLWEIYLVALSVRKTNDPLVFLGSTFTFNNLSISPEYAKTLKGKWTVKIGDDIIEFEILKLLGAPQGYLSFISNNAGISPGCVLDFGEYTLDVAFIQNGILDKLNSTSINIGSREIWLRVKNEIYKTTYSDIPVTALEMGEDIVYNGIKIKKWNLKKIYTEIFEDEYMNRFEIILEQALAGKPVNWLLITGGVASQFGRLLNKTFPKLKIYVADNPRMANVEGLKILLDKVSDDLVMGK